MANVFFKVSYKILLASVLLVVSNNISYCQTDQLEKKALDAFNQKKYAESEKIWKEIANNYAVENNPEKEIEALLEVFKGVMHQFKLDSAEQYGRLAVKKSKNNNLDKLYGQAMNSMMTLYEFKNQEDSILFAAQEILKTKNLGHEFYSDAHTSLANVYYSQGENVNFENSIQQAINIDLLHQDSSSLPFNLATYSYFKSNRGEYDEAITLIYQAIAYLRKDKDKFKFATLYAGISDLFLAIHNLQKAEEYSLESLKICEELNLKLTQVRPLTTLGAIYKRKGKYSQALNYYNSADSIIKNTDKITSKVSVNLGIASCKMFLNDFEGAKKMMNLCQSMISKIDDDRIRLDYDISLAHYHYNTDPINSLPYIQSAYEGAVLRNDTFEKKGLALLLSDYYARFNDYKLSLKYRREFDDAKDSLYQIQQSHFTHDIEAKYRKKEQDNQIKLLASENLLQTAQLKQQQWLIWASLLAIALFGCLVTFIVWLLEKVRTQKKLVEDSLDEKNVLLQEIHHRVKNNLQVVSSLLALQSKYIKDDNAINALKQGQDRVHSMALIHQDLYENKDLNGINCRNYFEQLVDNLFYSYNINEDEVNLIMNVDDIILDVDTMIPMGLVLNELVSNAFKHAFTNNENDSQITINLFEENHELILEVKDNGSAIKDTAGIEGKSFGFELIRAFSQKLKASLNIYIDNGLCVSLTITNYKKAA